MPQSSYYSLITNAGLLKEAAASAPGGSAVNLTHIAVGDGNGSNYEPVGSQTALVNELYRTTLTHVVIDGSNPNQLIVEGVINETIGSFHIREVGIFDSDGVLFAIGKYPETFKSTSASGSGKRLYIRMVLGFANAPQVTLIQSEDLNNDPNFNANVLAAIDDINLALALKLAKTANLSDLNDIIEARANLGLRIGNDVQPYDPDLATIAALAVARGDLIIGNASPSWSRLAKGSVDQVLKSDGTDIFWGVSPKVSGDIVQVVHFQTGAFAAGASAIPLDNTPPQSNEGALFMSQAITPTSISNPLLIEFIWNGTSDASNQYTQATLFKDADANALAVAGNYVPSGGGWINLKTRYKITTAGTISPITFKVRAGTNGGAMTSMNGQISSQYYGGAFVSSITIMEIKA